MLKFISSVMTSDSKEIEKSMTKEFTVPERLKPGDKVAIVAPSSGAASMFPWVYKQGLQRMKEVFGLEPVEFPTVSKDGKFLASNPQARAEDINNAFADKTIKAVIATIGGDDQIKIIDFLDKKVIADNPKMFLGLSDNTNLHLYLWNLGIVSYYGGSVMQQWAQNGKMDQYTLDNFKRTLFTNEIGRIEPSKQWTDVDFEWSDESLLSKEKPTEANPGWVWHNAEDKQVNGRLWGGCWEILAWHMLADKYLPRAEELKGAVLYMETSEEIPTADNVYRMLVGMGIRGLLPNFSAVLMGRPKTQHRGHVPQEGREKYLADQRDAVIKALKEYAPNVPAVFGLDFGHTDPQILVPNGGIAKINGNTRDIDFSYQY
jgi:muramoyltetrapeptide carboxypeptidase LdcA involved in peptidoglycan recycling